MSVPEVVIWSMAAGAIGAVVLFGLAELAVHPSAAGLQGTLYHTLALCFVFLLSGLPRAVWPGLDEQVLRVGQVMIGPLCNSLGNYWVRGWLGSGQRDGLMEAGLRIGGWISPLAGLLCLALPADQQLPAAGAICLLNSGVLFWLTTRGYLLGDRLALGMAGGGGLAIPAITGLYGLAMHAWTLPLAAQALLALCAVCSTACVSLMIWLRSHPQVMARLDSVAASQLDPLTKTYASITLVQKLLKAQRRRRRTRRHGAVLAIIVYDLDRLGGQLGPNGTNELFIAIAHRIQRQVGAVNPVGRYWDRCFVALVETIPSPSWMRTLGLRVASNLRRPFEIKGAHGETVTVRADIGVGVVHLQPGQTAVEDILHEAQRLAEAARRMRSRAATLDPVSGDVVAVEDADFGPRRHRHPGPLPDAVTAETAAARP